MAWKNQTAGYIPATGQTIKLGFSYSYVPFTALTSEEIRAYLETAGFSVISVDVGTLFPNTFEVTLLAPGGGKTMGDIGATIAMAIAASWRAWNVRVDSYQTETISIIPEPSTNQTLVIIAIAAIVVAGAWLSHKFL